MTSWQLRSSAEQPVEHAAAATAFATTAARGAPALGGRARISALEAPKVVAGGRCLLSRLAELNLVGIPVGVGHDHRDGLPVPLGGRRPPTMGLDGDHLVGARVDDG